MSVPSILLAQEAAARIEDPAFVQVSLGDWRLFLNRVQRDISLRRKVVEREDLGDLVLDERYPYPDELVQLRSVWFTSVPSDFKTFRTLGEMMEDEWLLAVDRNYPTGEPERYLARKGMFVLDKVPTTEVIGGLKIVYWGLPDEVSDITIGFLQLPDMARDHVVDGMVIMAQYSRGDERRAAAAEREWLKREEFLADPITDRSDDRRSSLRPKSLQDPFGGFV